jgi:hypothetical protein
MESWVFKEHEAQLLDIGFRPLLGEVRCQKRKLNGLISIIIEELCHNGKTVR